MHRKKKRDKLKLPLRVQIIRGIALYLVFATFFAHHRLTSVPQQERLLSDEQMAAATMLVVLFLVGLVAILNRYIKDFAVRETEARALAEVAGQIESGIVPEQTELFEPDFAAAAVAHPARELGGDFYDCFLAGEDGRYVCAVVGDVSGKGVTAALFMTMVKTMLRERLKMKQSPAAVLNGVNDEVCAVNPQGMFATVFAAVLDRQTGELAYANAGHTKPLLLGEEVTFLHPDAGVAIGLFEDAGIVEERLLLQSGDGILVYTDGIVEAVDTADAFFGEERLLSLVSERCNRGEVQPKELVEAVRDEVRAFSAGREPFDDLTMLALCRK